VLKELSAPFGLQASHSIVWCVQNALLFQVEQVVRNYKLLLYLRMHLSHPRNETQVVSLWCCLLYAPHRAAAY
jgi:hypothetical protein